jgi:hypothetical protein
MRRNWQHTGKPTQPTKPKGKNKYGKPYKPVQIPTAKKADVLGTLEKAAKSPPPSKEAKLDALRNAYPEELEVQGDELRGDARQAGASPKETDKAANTPPSSPPGG